jgi:hypothetical protein
VHGDDEVVGGKGHPLLTALTKTAAGYRFYLAVYVCKAGWITPVYMALIDPFRRWVIYPPLGGAAPGEPLPRLKEWDRTRFPLGQLLPTPRVLDFGVDVWALLLRHATRLGRDRGGKPRGQRPGAAES